MPQLAASVALHRLCLAIAGKVIWTTALVASRRTLTQWGVAVRLLKSKLALGHRGAPGQSNRSSRPGGPGGWRVGAVAHKMTGETAVIATARGTSADQAKGRAVSLNVS